MRPHFLALVTDPTGAPPSPSDLARRLRDAAWDADAGTGASETAASEAAGAGFGRAWAVGAVADGETLVQSRPVVRGGLDDFSGDVLRPPGSASLAVHQVRGGPSDKVLEFARFHRWVGVAHCPTMERSETPLAARVESQIVARLPDFLRRSLRTRSASELLLFGVLSALHRMDRLSSIPARPDEVRAALDAMFEDLAGMETADCVVLVLDGATAAGWSTAPMVHARPLPDQDASWSMVLSDTSVAGAPTSPGEHDDGDARVQIPVNARRAWSLSTDAPLNLQQGDAATTA